MAILNQQTRRRLIFGTILLMIAIFKFTIQADENVELNKCNIQTTCSQCITAGPSCSWCKSKKFSSKVGPRCESIKKQEKQCDLNDIISPNMTITHLKNEPLSKPNSNVNNIVQLVPQRINLKIRPNSPTEFRVKFRQAEDYPVDLYYLMDLSQSMKDDKENLAGLGAILGNTMGAITKDFQLGFGSFVDKRTAPFVSIVPAQFDAPCPGCAPPYGFINHMPLNRKTDIFVDEVNKSRISGNIDTPEGSFDAIMQAIVCTKDVGWREKARKILLVATDAGFHQAGDGKLGGVVIPNDGICHLTNQVYTESITQDYPSISQISRKVKEHNINILFAVSVDAFDIYDELSRYIEGSYSGKLSQNSDNIVELVKEQYKKISSSVELKDNSTNNVRVTYLSKCLNPSGTLQETSICKGLTVGSTVEYIVKVEVTSCPLSGKNWKQEFHISPVGLSETLVVELEVICECECEKEHMQEKNSGTCTGVGTYECGICRCPKDRLGDFCQCDRQNMTDGTDDTNCKQGNSSIACSGRGTCACGRCSCRHDDIPGRKIYGTYCECDDFSCVRHNNLICGGKDHGECDCGKCLCTPDWTGEACECSTSKDSCMGTNGEICSGKGICECGECKCDSSYEGLLCEVNVAPGGKCLDYKNCAQCAGFPKQSQANECEKCNFTIEVVPELGETGKGEYKCSFKDDDDCHFFFIYTTLQDGSTQTEVRVQQKRECPKPVNLPLVMTSVIGSVVAIGLALLLIWKLLTVLHDKREYAKFEKQLLLAKWNNSQNPTYVEPITTVKNPTYNTNDVD